jgi:hypothetical protein
MEPQTILFRQYLIEAVHKFLTTNGPARQGFAEFLSELVVCLSRYEEEGTALYPAVFICDRLETAIEKLGGRDPLLIGKGTRANETARQALKICSPLAERSQWAIFLAMSEKEISFGVFRAESSPLSPTAFSRLRAMEDRSGTFLLGITQVGQSIVEVRSIDGRAMQLYLSGSRIDSKSPLVVGRELVSAVSREAEEAYRPSLQDFYYRVFSDLIRVPHGSLIVVTPASRPDLDIFVDGVILAEPVHVVDSIKSYILTPNAESAARIRAQAALIKGMLVCDGITLLRSDGAVIGYNAFIENINHDRLTTIGGARRRVFDALARHVGLGIELVVYRSQDGALDSVARSERA